MRNLFFYLKCNCTILYLSQISRYYFIFLYESI